MFVDLNSIEKVKEFVNAVSKLEHNIDLVSGRYRVDAKSLLGVFSLDLSRPIQVDFNGNDNCTEIQNTLHSFESKVHM